jgi:hypothetical protein
MSLVDDDTIELEIMTSRLALAMMDRASWEFSDLRSRIVHLEQRGELEPQDLLRAHVLARIVVDAWRGAGLTQIGLARAAAHAARGVRAPGRGASYHETNRWLVERHVLPDVDLRPFIRRNRNAPMPTSVLHGAGPGIGGGGQGSSQFPAGDSSSMPAMGGAWRSAAASRGAASSTGGPRGGGAPRGFVVNETR